MSLSLKGKVVELLQEVTGTSARGEWKKREFVIETTEEQYPKKVCFTLFGDKTSLIEGVAVGQDVEVAFNLESREYNGRYFHNINAWKVDKVAAGDMAGFPPPEFPPFNPDEAPASNNTSSSSSSTEDSSNDLPF